jgi:hypothetical protein
MTRNFEKRQPVFLTDFVDLEKNPLLQDQACAV